MTDQATTDVERAWNSIRRAWKYVLAAAAIGALLGAVASPKATSATYEAIVATPPPTSASLLGKTAGIQPSLDDLLVLVQSQATRDRLGGPAQKAGVVGTVATDKSSVTLKITADDAASAKTAAEAFAADLGATYHDAVVTQANRGIKALDDAIAALHSGAAAIGAGDPSHAQAVSTLGEYTLQRANLIAVRDAQPRPAVLKLASSSSGSPLPLVILLTIALGGLAAALIGFVGLSGTRLVSAGDIDATLGAGSLLAVAGRGDPSWTTTAALSRLADDPPVCFVPASAATRADSTGSLLSASAFHVLSPVNAPGAAPDLRGATVVILARLGVDTARGVRLTASRLIGAGATVSGVVALEEHFGVAD